MTPFFRCKISSQLPVTEGDQHQTQISSFSLGTSSACTSPCPPFLFDTQRDHKPVLDGALHEEIKGSTWCNYGIVNQSSSDLPQEPVKWMSSKMRIMRKMINSYQTPTTKPRRCTNHPLQDQKKANLESIIRVCSDCNTTKTPLWRSGPCGPKSLCNACGIRQRKARRAMAASVMKEKASPEVDRTVPFKKRCRFSAAAVGAAASVQAPHERKLCFEDIVIRLSKSSAFQRVFPQDEKDAAILLMALSSGLLCSS